MSRGKRQYTRGDKVPGGMHVVGVPPRSAYYLLHSIRVHDNPPVHEAYQLSNRPVRCPLCSEAIRNGSGSVNAHDPITGVCNATRACAKRREELDDETIEFLGLVPRERNGGPND
jgi:hypothetical protein